MKILTYTGENYLIYFIFIYSNPLIFPFLTSFSRLVPNIASFLRAQFTNVRNMLDRDTHKLISHIRKLRL